MPLLTAKNKKMTRLLKQLFAYSMRMNFSYPDTTAVSQIVKKDTLQFLFQKIKASMENSRGNIHQFNLF